MYKLLLIFTITLFACSQSSTDNNINSSSDSSNNNRINSKEANDYAIEKNRESFQNQDSTINNKLVLGSAESITTSLGDISRYLIISNNEAPYVIIKNQSNTKTLKMSMWNGDGPNQFRYFEVSYTMPSKSSNKNSLTSDYEDFETENGIKLGVTKQSIISNKGDSYTQIKSENLDGIRYWDGELYEAIFYFKNDTLKKYQFGYLYP